MSQPRSKDFTIKTNGYWTQVWQINNKGTPVNLTGYDFEIQIRDAKSPNANVFTTINVDNGGIVVDAINGQITISIPPMSNIEKQTVAYYDLVAVSNTRPVVLLEGKVILDPGTTYVT